MHPLINQSHCLTDKNTPEHYHRLYTHAKRVLYKYRTRVSSPSSSDFTASFINNCSTSSSLTSTTLSSSLSSFSSSSSLSSASSVLPTLSSTQHTSFSSSGQDKVHGTEDTGHEMHDDEVCEMKNIETASGRKRDAFEFDE